MDDSTLDLQNCEWTLNVTSCIGQDFFQVVYGVTTYLSLFVFLCAVWLFSWRLYSRPGSTLFSMKGFLTLEGFLFTQIFWGGARMTSCLILLYNVSPTNIILREILFDVTWLLGTVSVATYLAGVLRTIPRTIVITCSSFIGYLRDTTTSVTYLSINSKTITTLMIIQYLAHSISCFLIAIGFLIYGNKLIRIAGEGLSMFEDAIGYPTTPRSNRFSYSNVGVSTLNNGLEQRHHLLERSIIKMRILNYAFIASFVILGAFIGIFAFFYQSIFENLTLSKAFAALVNWIPMILSVCVMAGITYGEIRIPDKSEPTLTNLMFPTTPTSPQHSHPYDEEILSITSSSTPTDGRSSFHSRNASTDSDAPLLKWPIPKAVAPMHVRTNELNYISQDVGSPLTPTSTAGNITTNTTTT
ncbi:14005_t:CDS:2 [Acaulospora morrowiae]|uniref:14005_t:CDS:1 n=1 Tax=Acaulospora morrowiae TaxID=94023 RepID=A0A9N8ZQC3_9GLOM|nr:14005_t:CDS:2 [Acaulospora morrowiae]